METKYQKLQAVLEWVNSVREMFGHQRLDELPKAQPGCPKNCVLAVALPGKVEVSGAAADWCSGTPVNAGWVLPLPDYVQRFVNDFDLGCYLELVAEPEPATDIPF